MRALELDAALVHVHRADAAGNAQILGPDPLLRRPLLHGRQASLSCRASASCAPRTSPPRARSTRSASTAAWSTPSSRRRAGAGFTVVRAGLRRDEAAQRQYAASATRSRAAGTTFYARFLAEGARREPADFALHEVCVVACAEAWRGDGEILASPIGTLPPSPRAWPRPPSRPTCSSPTAWRPSSRACPRSTRHPPRASSRAGCPTAPSSTSVWSGRRHVMMGASQIDRFGNQNISCIGDHAKPKVAARRDARRARATPSTTRPATGSRRTRRASSSRRSTSSAASATTAPRRSGAAAASTSLRRVVTNLAVLDFETPDHSMRLASCHPGVSRRGRRARDRLPARRSRDRVDDDARARPPRSCACMREVIDPQGARREGARRDDRALDTRICEPLRHRATPSCRRAWAGCRARGSRPPRAPRAGSASSRRRR